MTLPDPTTDPAGFVLAVADQREQRARQVPGEVWTPYERKAYHAVWASSELGGPGYPVAKAHSGHRQAVIEHIAAEANPEHALKEVALWRGIVERHTAVPTQDSGDVCYSCALVTPWPCLDLLGVVAAAEAYATKELG